MNPGTTLTSTTTPPRFAGKSAAKPRSILSITVYCTRGPIGTYLENSSYSIDNGPVSLWTRNDTINAIQWMTVCYSSPVLPYGQHGLTITNYGDWFFLDYLQIATPDPPSGPVSSSGDLSSSISSGSTSTSVAQTAPTVGGGAMTSASSILSRTDATQATPLAQSSSIAKTSQSSTVSLGTGAIVGIVGATLFACLAIGFLLLCMRKRRAGKPNHIQPYQPPFSHVPHGPNEGGSKASVSYNTLAVVDPSNGDPLSFDVYGRPIQLSPYAGHHSIPPTVEDRRWIPRRLMNGDVHLLGQQREVQGSEVDADDLATLPPAYSS
ncbi:hypothetical protein OBBRIDRAFT_204893 [Obba rivulosa]|uniref:Uncharacterized protein n=1 Tax=Obba rivulosa TaxID=1052685 RepID=A0A8E2ALG1_9APHY|nr:hypothetical protein OBBRIDRAFT_204893 [Obba rivulosa]